MTVGIACCEIHKTCTYPRQGLYACMVLRINRGGTPEGFNKLAFAMESGSVVCKIGTEFLIVICMNFGLQVVNPVNHRGNYMYLLIQC